MNFNLTKKNSLKSSSELDLVFKKGDNLSSSLISLHYKHSSNDNLKVAFSVGKKKHKLAVDRNRIKRLMRESFRINANNYVDKSISYNIAFVFIGSNLPKYVDVENSMNSLLLSFKNKALS